MNKKLLFAALSLAALTACTNDDFEKQQIAAEESSPVQFEVINNAFTRASMDGNKVKWSAADGDLFTLYHGNADGVGGPWTTGYENATYKANAEDGKAATLTTPTMIKKGMAMMVWPVDTMFNITPTDALSLTIPANQPADVENNIPYVSDLIEIEAWAEYSEDAPAPGVIPTAYKTAGYGRKYAVYMRPMASQLNLNADYAGTDKTLEALYEGDDPIDEIKVTSVELLTKKTGTPLTKFTTSVPVKFTAPSGAITTQWAGVANNKWKQVTDFNVGAIAAAGQTDKLTTKCLTGNTGSKFLILPQATIPAGNGLLDAGIVVNTLYGKVVIADGVHGSQYTGSEIADAWYRYVSAVPTTEEEGETTDPTPLTIDDKTKYKATSNPKFGLKQTINGFSAYKSKDDDVVKGEPVGAAATRYVKVLLTHLDMSNLHIKNDKQLRDAVKVWQKMGLPSVTVYLDGDSNNGFLMTQKTIKTINDINAAAGGKFFSVMPCNETGEKCNNIFISHKKAGETPSDIDKIQDLTFIVKNGTKKANVRLQKDENWKWDGEVKIATAATTGIDEIYNLGTLTNTESKILKITDGTNVIDITFVNDASGKWNITAGTIRVQNDIRNNGTINISKGAQYRQDGAGLGAGNAVFTNNAQGLPTRFAGNNKFGKINNYGVLGTISGGEINNYGLIEHADKDAKTLITHNQTAGADFATAFAAGNMKGRINLPYSNKDEDNISISANSAAPYEGFISVTVDELPAADNKTLQTSAVGKFVNYMIIKSGVDQVSYLPSQVEYLEFDTDHEVYWSFATPNNLVGLIILSDINIKLGTTITADVTYLGAEMYVSGTFNYHDPTAAYVAGETWWDGYYGATGTRVAEHYVTF